MDYNFRDMDESVVDKRMSSNGHFKGLQSDSDASSGNTSDEGRDDSVYDGDETSSVETENIQITSCTDLFVEAFGINPKELVVKIMVSVSSN